MCGSGGEMSGAGSTDRTENSRRAGTVSDGEVELVVSRPSDTTERPRFGSCCAKDIGAIVETMRTRKCGRRWWWGLRGWDYDGGGSEGGSTRE
jgi:hypothetical protein